ncbi:oligopeptide ABC transporter permease [Macrococcus equipercicus]|uniref:ABC transporter permease n=1 Tax=Macrococcus equipercicus TaxID=69967 RepID=A0A9Q9BW84_9STAP|nr:oligopeptide ABC transporter permease [Macrococcus equipercicus]UTH14447.1 ABC transporter permease [Macrococcus equipercicus]
MTNETNGNQVYTHADLNQEQTTNRAQPFILANHKEIYEEKIERQSKTFWQDAWLQLRSNKGAVAGLIGLILLLIMAFLGPAISGHTYRAQNIDHTNLPPKIEALKGIDFLPFTGKDKDGYDMYAAKKVEENYWFGTDDLGRDIFTRVWKGTQVSLLIGVVAALLDVLIGITYGAISGFFGGWIDTFMQRVIEIIASIPNLIIMILFVIVFDASIVTIILAMSLTGWIGMSRIVRGQFLKLKNQEYVMASRTLGASNMSLIFKHILPNALGPIIVTAMFSIPSAIFFEAFLSFIGLGIPAPAASLGSLVNDGRKMLLSYPYQMFTPAAILSLLILCFYLFGDGVRDAFDPKMRK